MAREEIFREAGIKYKVARRDFFGIFLAHGQKYLRSTALWCPCGAMLVFHCVIVNLLAHFNQRLNCDRRLTLDYALFLPGSLVCLISLSFNILNVQ